MKIFKYQLPDSGELTLRLPPDCDILHVAFQHENLYVWIAGSFHLTDQSEMTFHVLMTGREFTQPSAWRFVGTAITPDANYVVHVYRKWTRA